MDDQQLQLSGLIEYLAVASNAAAHCWGNWSIAPIHGGANNLLFRATSAPDDLAIKFTIRDERDRAGREYAALLALHQAGIQLAPQPILFEPLRFPQPVVVQTWLVGQVSTAPPRDDVEWLALLRHYAAIHALTPAQVEITVPDAVLNVTSVETGKQLVRLQEQRIPPAEQPPALRVLLRQFRTLPDPGWPAPRRALCRVDANSRNFIRRPGGWMSVDWENSGWGDPAFEIAELITHPAYRDVPAERWDWVVHTYSHLSEDRWAATRIEVYRTIMLMWWVVRLARTLYEVPRGLDQRLVERQVDWQAETTRLYQHYLDLAAPELRRRA